MTNAIPCPRCAYDLSGVAASWCESCPLAGACSECGLPFRWAEILNPRLTTPAWSFEHAPRSRFLALLRTAYRAVRPPLMWQDLRMEHPVRARRLAVGAAVGVGLSWLSAATLICTFGLAAPSLITLSLPGAWAVHDVVGVALWPYGFSVSSRPWAWSIEPWILVGVAWWCLLPLGFLALPVTLRRARVRARHLARVWAYSLVSLPIALVVWLMPGAVETVSWSVVEASAQPNPGLWQTATWLDAQARDWQWMVFAGVLALWGLLIWRSAIRQYLRLPHAEGIALAAGVLVASMVLLGALLIPGMATALFYDL